MPLCHSLYARVSDQSHLPSNQNQKKKDKKGRKRHKLLPLAVTLFEGGQLAKKKQKKRIVFSFAFLKTPAGSSIGNRIPNTEDKQ